MSKDNADISGLFSEVELHRMQLASNRPIMGGAAVYAGSQFVGVASKQLQIELVNTTIFAHVVEIQDGDGWQEVCFRSFDAPTRRVRQRFPLETARRFQFEPSGKRLYEITLNAFGVIRAVVELSMEEAVRRLLEPRD